MDLTKPLREIAAGLNAIAAAMRDLSHVTGLIEALRDHGSAVTAASDRVADAIDRFDHVTVHHGSPRPDPKPQAKR